MQSVVLRHESRAFKKMDVVILRTTRPIILIELFEKCDETIRWTTFHQYIMNFLCLVDYAIFLTSIFRNDRNNIYLNLQQITSF